MDTLRHSWHQEDAKEESTPEKAKIGRKGRGGYRLVHKKVPYHNTQAYILAVATAKLLKLGFQIHFQVISETNGYLTFLDVSYGIPNDIFEKYL